jgi:hypothetical protein
MSFIANKGQFEDTIEYYGEFPGGKIFFNRGGQIVYYLASGQKSEAAKAFEIREQFLHGQPAQITGQAIAPAKVNYFIGSNPDRWHQDVPTYHRVNFGEIYEKINLVFEARNNMVEKLFYIAPGGDPSRIRIQLTGAETVSIDDSGQLIVQITGHRLKFSAPVAYQVRNGRRCVVKTAYTLAGNQYGFKVAAYDTTRELVIDPLISSTFMGEFSIQPRSYNGMAMAADASGNVFVASTSYYDFLPGTAKAYQKDLAGDYDMVITKYSSDLKTLLAATFLGGTEEETASDIALDASGNVFVAGTTASEDFPLTANTHNGRDDAVVAKLSNDLSSLQGALLVGGSYTEYAHAMALNESGLPYITGHTFSADFPVTPGAYEYEESGQSEVFVTQLNTALSAIVASTVFGGPEHDSGEAIAIAPGGGHVYIAGGAGYKFPTPNGDKTVIEPGDRDAMVAMLTGNLSSLSAATYIGGSNADMALSIAFNGGERVYVSGITESKDIWHKNTRTANGYSLFISEVSPQLNGVTTTLFEGSGNHWPTGLAISNDNYVYVTGWTTSNDFPTTEGTYDPSFNGNKDGFIIKLSESIWTTIACTYWGGAEDDLPHDVIIDTWGNIYITGVSVSEDLPITASAYHKTFFGYGGYTSNGFIARFSPDLKLSDLKPDGPRIYVIPNPIDIGEVKIGHTQKSPHVIILNQGNQDLTISSIAIEGRDRDDFAFTYDDCSGVTVSPNSSCLFGLMFEPLLDTASVANLSIKSNDSPRSPFIISLKGQGKSSSFKEKIPAAIINLLLLAP